MMWLSVSERLVSYAVIWRKPLTGVSTSAIKSKKIDSRIALTLVLPRTGIAVSIEGYYSLSCSTCNCLWCLQMLARGQLSYLTEFMAKDGKFSSDKNEDDSLAHVLSRIQVQIWTKKRVMMTRNKKTTHREISLFHT